MPKHVRPYHYSTQGIHPKSGTRIKEDCVPVSKHYQSTKRTYVKKTSRAYTGEGGRVVKVKEEWVYFPLILL
jgi:hypothetical protein